MDLQVLVLAVLVCILLGLVVVVSLAVRYDRQQQHKVWNVKNEESDGPYSKLFPNLPNLRQVGGVLSNGRKIREGMLFRSSRTDFLNSTEQGEFKKLGIKSIIDLRHIDEYRKANGAKILDSDYPVCVIKKGKMKEFRSKTSADSAFCGRRYLINIMTMNLIWSILMRVNFFIRYGSLCFLLVDKLYGTHLFLRFYTWWILNQIPMYEQYVDLLEFGKSAVVDILRVMITSSPVLVHCAHGKDRTGVVIAVSLALLGMSEENIAQEYSLSEAGLGPIRQRLYQETAGRYGWEESFTSAKPETMRKVLKEINRRYGSVNGYLESAGFGANEQEQLKNVLLE